MKIKLVERKRRSTRQVGEISAGTGEISAGLQMGAVEAPRASPPPTGAQHQHVAQDRATPVPIAGRAPLLPRRRSRRIAEAFEQASLAEPRRVAAVDGALAWRKNFHDS
jgi:hypothetical protein